MTDNTVQYSTVQYSTLQYSTVWIAAFGLPLQAFKFIGGMCLMPTFAACMFSSFEKWQPLRSKATALRYKELGTAQHSTKHSTAQSTATQVCIPEPQDSQKLTRPPQLGSAVGNEHHNLNSYASLVCMPWWNCCQHTGLRVLACSGCMEALIGGGP